MSAPFCSHGWLQGDCPYCKVQQLELQNERLQKVVNAAIGLRDFGSDLKNGTHAGILWSAIAEYEMKVIEKRNDVCECGVERPLHNQYAASGCREFKRVEDSPMIEQPYDGPPCPAAKDGHRFNKWGICMRCGNTR